MVKDIGYLIDEYDESGGYDTFYSFETMQKTTVEKKEDGTYLINNNEDGEMGYIYDPETDTLLEYSKAAIVGATETDNNTIVYIFAVGIIIGAAALSVIVYLKKNYYI